MEIDYPDMRLKSETNRQSSLPAYGSEKKHIESISDKAIDNSFTEYVKLINLGVAPETARMILPMATSTTIYMNGTLRSWLHYIEVRCDEHSQQEHRDIANECREILIELYPNVIKQGEEE
jgi:thymidylate synthase (FAD)